MPVITDLSVIRQFPMFSSNRHGQIRCVTINFWLVRKV